MAFYSKTFLRNNLKTREYELNHGKKPRGYGDWLFVFSQNGKKHHERWFVGMFSDCKEKAVLECITHHCTGITLMP